MPKAVTYVRVSSREQQELGNSLGAQKRLLWEFARNNGYNVVKEGQSIGGADSKVSDKRMHDL